MRLSFFTAMALVISQLSYAVLIPADGFDEIPTELIQVGKAKSIGDKATVKGKVIAASIKKDGLDSQNLGKAVHNLKKYEKQS